MERHDRAFHIIVETPDEGKRLDHMVSACVPDCSRSMAAELIRAGSVQVGGDVKKAGYKVRAGDEIRGVLPQPTPSVFLPEPIAIHILYEDSAIVVINKQPGIVVHPAPGHAQGTLVNALLHHCPAVEAIGGQLRPGIVHRLDRDTSGAMVVAKTGAAMTHLSDQFKARTVEKEYSALVWGVVAADTGIIALPIGRHPVDRKRMSTHSRKSRTAETHWQVESRLGCASLLRVRIRTGRTHQIRVHCAAIHHPVIGDTVYGGRKSGAAFRPHIPIAAEVRSSLESARRQMLHARKLGFIHPLSGEKVVFEAPLPHDMARMIEILKTAYINPARPGDLQRDAKNDEIT